MTWTRKDFEAVAERVVDLYPLDERQDPQDLDMPVADRHAYRLWERTRETFADLCAERGGLNVNGNRRFDRERFMARTDRPKHDRIVRSLNEGSK